MFDDAQVILLEKSLAVGVTLIITALSTGGTTLIPLNTANAANINCAGVLTTCNGTNQGDNIIGDDKTNSVCGRGGNDRIILFAGGDGASGNEGNDNMNGGEGNDVFIGGSGSIGTGPGGGADNLFGGSGNDAIGHDDADSPTVSDGARDKIDCGPGNDDRAFINTSIDGDIAVNCEQVFAG